MSPIQDGKEWMMNLSVLPAAIPLSQPPKTDRNDRLITSILCLTLGDSLSDPSIDSYLLEHIDLERKCSHQTDLELAWSDDVALTLCFITSLTYCGGYSRDHLTQQYMYWWMNGFMSPTGHCFTPTVHIKQTIEQMSIVQAAESIGVINDEKIYTSPPLPRAAALLRISPIAYFYANSSSETRLEVIKSCTQAMFGQTMHAEIFATYVELLANAVNGQSKDRLLQSVRIDTNQYDFISAALTKLIDILRNDNNDIQLGVKQALAFNEPTERECKWLNPYDSNRTLIVTLYLQVAGALYYETVPHEWLARVYAKDTLVALAQWLSYEQSLQDLQRNSLL